MNRQGLKLACVLLALVLAATSLAGEDSRARVSMLVTGRLTVSAQGNVTGWSLDRPDKLPPQVKALLEQAVPDWRFKPVLQHGSPIAVHADMSLRVVARPDGSDRYALGIAAVSFTRADDKDRITSRRRPSPRYPAEAIRERVGGTVYAVAQIDERGHVTRTAAEQVNLFREGNPVQMRHWRELLADATFRALRTWTFTLPEDARARSRSSWAVRIPITYSLVQRKRKDSDDYGIWVAYYPGPHQDVDWLESHDSLSGDPDALPGSGIFLVDQDGLQLLNGPAG